MDLLWAQPKKFFNLTAGSQAVRRSLQASLPLNFRLPGDDITSHMKILFYGAGVIGGIYSAKLYKGGIDVTLLARGKRYESLKQNGVIINDISRGGQTIGP